VAEICNRSVKTDHQTSMCLDSQGHPRVSYYREEYSNKRSARNLKYAYFEGTNWYIQTVDYRSGSGRWNAIALDRGEHLYISYSIGTVGYLGLANQGNSGWEHALAAVQESTGKADSYGVSSLVLDTHDEPHLAYIDIMANAVDPAVLGQQKESNAHVPTAWRYSHSKTAVPKKVQMKSQNTN
jgi:hypothetical protein